MLLLITFVLFALVFSFLCSIAEAVILSVTPAYVAVLEKDGKSAGPVLRELRADVNKPLAAILTLNTIAHTVGAAGAGAQAAVVFGSAYLGIASAILTLLILIFSEIIPKTLGAHYWRQLAPITGHSLKILVWLLYPFVLMAEKLTGGMTEGPTLSGFNRSEFAAMAELSATEGLLAEQESEILKNLMRLQNIQTRDAMTPRTVLFTLSETMTVGEYVRDHGQVGFTRIPVYGQDHDQVNGFVLRGDLLQAHTQGKQDSTLKDHQRDMPALPETLSLARAFNQLIRIESHIALVVDEYGDPQGILTLEDILETLLGLEIVDEGDGAVDMQELARREWEDRSEDVVFDPDGSEN
jgi:CBS domain containing-hemolysin-like protein